ncbi:MFS transporter [Paeniglutamicibacter sp. Y32M11]|uniref:MFS transporter n=1 Tax=Paeniglutamicibacter sp. Y32M11 TaxID=2853258 RepID=UPI001C532A59|nr:MFS transporter [Paeniglutamicibacter sp. Y32M11]QXQ09341.1 MFS transporter [Paeniglutamicibacter sp. Y32M11]
MARLLADLTPLRESPAFKRLWIGNALSAVGGQLTLVAVSLEVYALTGSSLYVGLLGAFALVPLVLAGLYGGAIADAYDRRKVALASALVLWTATAAIAAQAWLGVDNVWLLYGLVAIHSAAGGINQPTRGAIIPAIVGLKNLPAANSLNMVTFGISQMIGPLLGGLLVAQFGFGWTYTIDVLTYAAAVWSVYKLPSLPPEGTPAKAGLRSVIEGFKFLGTQPNVRMTFLIDIAAMVLAAPRALLPAIGAILIGGGELTMGLLLAATALGAFLAGMFSGPVGRIHRQGLAVFICVCLWGASIGLFGVVVVLSSRSPVPSDGSIGGWIWPAAACMALAGVADAVSSVFRTTILQSATPDHLRGRLQGVFIVVVAGGPRLGEMLSGGVAGGIGEGWTLVFGGLACIAAASALMRWEPGFLRYDSRRPSP